MNAWRNDWLWIESDHSTGDCNDKIYDCAVSHAKEMTEQDVVRIRGSRRRGQCLRIHASTHGYEQ